MKLNRISGILMAAALLGGVWLTAADRHSPIGYTDTPVLPGQKWKVHDIDRPRPRMVTPGAKPGDAPSDAIVLFDGKDLSHWMCHKKGELAPPTWKLENGYVQCVGSAGDLVSKEKFGDAQFHIEWASPEKPEGTSQWRGNSGILLMERYEIQVLDSWNNPTYADGQAGAIYGQWPPLVNPVRPPGEWQTYDIVFEAPKFDGDTVVKQGNVTVFLNGILLHNRKEIIGAMAHRKVGVYKAHATEESLGLQDHDTPVRYRNIWARRLTGYDQPEAK
jgi:hypothetical protein